MACNCSTAHAYSCKTAARANEPTGLLWGRLQINAATVECSQGCHRGLPGHHCLPSTDCRLHSAVLALRQLLPSIFVVGIHEYARTTPWAATPTQLTHLMRQKVVVWFLAKGNQWPKADAEWLGELSEDPREAPGFYTAKNHAHVCYIISLYRVYIILLYINEK